MSWLIYSLTYIFLAGLAINLGYHRCLAHRSVRLPRIFERILITLGLPAGTPIQWAGNHRYHHRYADRANDPHSPLLGGFWHAHVGWYIGTSNPWICAVYSLAGPLRALYDGWNRPRTNQQHNALASDVAQDPYYRFISRPLPYFVACAAHTAGAFLPAMYFWGLKGIAVMWLTSVTVYNIGDSIDSVAHLVGDQPLTNGPDRARNNRLLGYLALGEGWHANHHAFPHSARHGLFPGQFDWTWQVIRLLKRAGLADRIIEPREAEIQGRLRV